MTKPSIQFPKDFLWGCATSAYQIEGSPLADGAGPSVWHRFSHTPGRVQDGDTGDVTCDHYRRWESDVDLMQSLGLNSYRFSIAWGRVLPEGTGRINAAGLDFYERLVDRLLSRGIQPMVTLFHWDLPAALDDRGGWLNRDIAHWFAEYANVVFRRLDDRVKYWTTLNEPWVVADGGYMHGVLAPGHRNIFEAPRAAHHLMMAHGAAVQAYRAVGRNNIGLVVNIEPKYPASQSDADLAATRRADAYMNRQYLDPALLGSYPEELHEVFGDACPKWPEADLELIKQPLDYIGVNYYTRAVVRSDPNAWPLKSTTVKQNSTRTWKPAGKCIPKVSSIRCCGSGTTTATLRCTSPRTAHVSSIRRKSTDRCSKIRCASTTCASTSRPSTPPSNAARTFGVTSRGRCSTTSNGRSASRSASASSI